MALDNFRKINITLNKANQHVLEPQIAKVGDVNGRELVVQLIDGGVIKDQTGVTLKLNWQHANGNQGSESFKALDAKRGLFSVYYPKNMLFRGTVISNISINEKGKITNSLNFQIAVKGDVFDGSAVEVDGILFTLKDLKNQLDARDENLENLENRQDSIEIQFNSVQQELTGEDVISAPEIIAARNGEDTLSDRLDKENQEVNAQLAQNEDKTFHNSLVNHKSSGKFITIIDDDADKGFYTKLAPIARSYGIPLTSAVITQYFDGTMETPPRKMTLEQMHELNEEGFEFISHTKSHNILTTESDDFVINELTKSQKFLKEQGFNHRALAYPHNLEDERIHNLVRQYYDIAFSGGHVVNKHPINQMAMHRVALELSLDGILSRIEEASELNTWLIMICHVDQGDWFTETKFRTVIEKALSEGFEFVTVEEGVKRKGNLAHFGGKTINSDGAVYGGDIKVADVEEYAGSTPPSKFPTETITIQKVRIRDLEDWGLGELSVGGYVFTYRDHEDVYAFQKFVPSVKNDIRPNDILYRTWATDVLVWRKWRGSNGITVGDIGEYTGNTPPSGFMKDTITIQKIRNQDLKDWGLGDLPRGGLVYTYKDYDDTYTYQTFVPSVQNNFKPEDVLYRTWATDVLVWRDWNGYEGNSKINWNGSPKVHNKPITDYPVNKITKENIKGAEAPNYGFNYGGMLWTIRDSDDSFSYQKFVPVSSPDISKVKYRKWQTWNNSWGEF